VRVCVASVTRCAEYNLLKVDHGEPLGLLHESAYIPTNSWRAQGDQSVQSPDHPDHSEHSEHSVAQLDQGLLAPDPPDLTSWQVCLC
jgi:hypothetical protein